MHHNTQTYLMHCERLHLSLQNLHPCCCHYRADIWHNSIREYFIDKTMVSKIASICHMLHRIAIILVCNKSKINSSQILSKAKQSMHFQSYWKKNCQSNGSAVTFFILRRLDVYTSICRFPRSNRWPLMGFPIFCSSLGWEMKTEQHNSKNVHWHSEIVLF